MGFDNDGKEWLETLVANLLTIFTFFFSSPGNLGTRFHITKYPTLKYVRNGIVAKREYRGQRSAEAFVEFIKEQTIDPVKEYKDVQELSNMDVSLESMSIIGSLI